MNTIIDTISIWTTAQKLKTSGRGRSADNQNLHGINKLRELILELAIQGKLVKQDPNDEPASILLKKIALEKRRLEKAGEIKIQPKLQEISEEEKLLELPENWEWTRLGTISIINPRNDAKDESLASFVPMPLVTTSHTGKHGQEERIWGDIKQGYTHFADGDIGLAKITPCFENSKAVVFSNLIKGIGAGTTELHIARPYGKTLSARYVLLYLKAPQFLYLGATKMTGTAGQKRVPKNFFAENPFPLPPLAEQHRIVAKVDELMALCDQLEKQQTDSNSAHEILVETLLDTLTNAPDQADLETARQRISNHFDTLFTTEYSIDRLKQTILQLAVMGKLVPQNPDDEPASVLLKKIAKEKARLVKEGIIKKQEQSPEIEEDEKLFGIPMGWVWALGLTVAEFVDPQPSHRTPPEFQGGVPYVGYSDINHITGIDFSNARKVAPSVFKEHQERYQVKLGDFVFGKIGTLGAPYFLPEPFDYCLSANLILIQPKLSIVEPRFLAFFLDSPAFIQVLGDKKTNSTHGVFGIKKARLITLPLPPLAEQHRIVTKVDELFAICDALKERINESQVAQLNLADALVDGAVG